MKKLIFIIILFLSACSPKTNSDKIQVITTFYPLAYFTERIGGDHVEVVNLTENSGDAHHFEPVMQDRIKIEEADMFVYNGLGLEEWVEDVLKSVEKDLLIVESSGDMKSEDPHIWLDPVLAKQQAISIYNGLSAIDELNKDYYQKNMEVLSNEFDELIEKFDNDLVNVVGKTVFIDHLTFYYLQNRFNFIQYSLSGFIPETDPSFHDLDNLIQEIENQNAGYFLVSENQTEKISDTIKKETDIEVLEYYSMEIVSKDMDYFSMMYHNLDVLREALDA